MPNSSIPDCSGQSLAKFKLGFGEEVIILPGAYDYIYDANMRSFYDNAMIEPGQVRLML